MLVGLILFLIAAAIGWRRAARRGGTTADKMQYALAHGIPAFLLGLVLVIVVARLGWFA